MSALDTPTAPAVANSALRRLYLARFAFAIVWAALFAATSEAPLGAFAFALAVLYPAFDLAAAVVDARSDSSAGRSRVVLHLNAAISLVAAAGIVAVGQDDLEGILMVWGVWAIASGLVQLAAALVRRALGGQWPMIVSGALSVLAGGAFISMAPEATSLRSIAGYATLGGIFFLVSALRLGRDSSAPAKAA